MMRWSSMQASTKRQIILINCLSRLNVSSSSMPQRQRERETRKEWRTKWRKRDFSKEWKANVHCSIGRDYDHEIFHAQNVSWCRLMRIFTFWAMDIIRMDHYPHLRCAIMLRDLSCFSTAAVPRRLMFLWQLQISAIIKCDWSLRFIDCDFFRECRRFFEHFRHMIKKIFNVAMCDLSKFSNYALVAFYTWLFLSSHGN